MTANTRATEQPTIKQLNAELWQVFQMLKEGTIERADADSLANVAGKIFRAADIQLKAREMDGIQEVNLLGIPKGLAIKGGEPKELSE